MDYSNDFRCYHVTTEDRLESILKYGLKPNSHRNRSARPAPHIMLSLYPYWNLYNGFKKDAQLVLIEICDPEIKCSMFDDDPEGLAWEKTIKPEYFNTIVRFEVVS